MGFPLRTNSGSTQNLWGMRDYGFRGLWDKRASTVYGRNKYVVQPYRSTSQTLRGAQKLFVTDPTCMSIKAFQYGFLLI